MKILFSTGTPMLSQKQYFVDNMVNFQDLTLKQKRQKYTKYVARYKRINGVGNSNKMTNIYPKQQPKINRVNRNKALRSLQPKETNVKLSECLMLYARASIDPFGNFQQMPCIPDTITAPSFKFRTFVDTNIFVGTETVGYAAFNPWTMACNDNGSAGEVFDYPIIGTTATYNQSSYTASAAALAAGQIFASNSNSFYSDSTITPGSLRLVAAGLELEYSGQLMDQAGVISVIQWDGLNAVPNPSTTDQIRLNQRTMSCPTQREARCYVRYEPVDSENFSYAPLSQYRPSQNPTLDPKYYPLLVYISGATPGTSFRIRAVSFFELQLSNAPISPSESDPIGFPALQAARSSVLPSSDPGEDLTTILKKTIRNIATTVSGFAPAIGTSIGAALGQPAIGHTVGNFSKTLIESLL